MLNNLLKTVVGKLIALNVVVYLAQKMARDGLMAHFALWPLGHYPVAGTNFSVGFEPWQIITSAFLHSPDNFTHILFNMYGLFAFGAPVERALGSMRFTWLYFASVITASLAQLIVATMSADSGVFPTVGASGGVFGVLLAFGLLFPQQRVMLIFPPIPMPAWLLVAGYGTIELLNGVFGTQQGVAHFAHLGGMLGAFIVMLTFWRRARMSD